MNPNQSTETSIDNLEFQIAGLKDEIENNEVIIKDSKDAHSIVLIREDNRLRQLEIEALEAQKLRIKSLKV